MNNIIHDYFFYFKIHLAYYANAGIYLNNLWHYIVLKKTGSAMEDNTCETAFIKSALRHPE